jgi:hypothetical protein
MVIKRELTVGSPIGKVKLDRTGSAIAAIKVDPAQAYSGMPGLLKSVIYESNPNSWKQIKEKIDYTYAGLGQMLNELDEETHFTEKIKSQIKIGKKLLFKPNLVAPTCIDNLSHGEGLGNNACTPWAFIAALMRWFHDKLDISYYKMAIGEGASTTSITAGFYSLNGSDGNTITTEAVISTAAGAFTLQESILPNHIIRHIKTIQ